MDATHEKVHEAVFLSPPPPQSVNAFDPEFLSALDEMDTMDILLEAELAGPWRIHRLDGHLRVYRLWEEPGSGSLPEAVFREMSDALRFLAALLPAGREVTLRLGQSRQEDGFPLWSNTTRIGSLRCSGEPLVQALHVMECLARSPYHLTALLASAGPLVIREVGSMLRQGLPAWREGELGIFGGP